MATRNIVPRTTEEGQIGTTAKKWLKGYFKDLYMGSTPAKCSVEGHTHSAATTSAAGLVELATDAEFDAGTDTARYASVAQIRKRIPLGFKNLLINGAFSVNQRGYASATATTGANQYTLDRWKVVTSGEALSWTDSNGTRTVTAPVCGIEQVVEGATLQSGAYSISWTGTAICTVGGTARANGEAFSVTGGSNVTVKFINGTVANAQLELGGYATPFEWRPYGLELMLCQRYFQSVLKTKYFPAVRVDANAIYFTVPLVGHVRANPTVVIAIPNVYNFASGAKQSGFTFSINAGWSSPEAVLVIATKTSHGLSSAFLGIDTNGDLQFSAEL